VTGPRIRGENVGSRNMSITYRGSIYEKSWETHFYNTVVRTLDGDSGWLCESATATSRCAASTPCAHLPNH